MRKRKKIEIRTNMFSILDLLGYYAISLPFLGLIGNSIIFLICLKEKYNSMFVLLCFLASSDFLSLIFWNAKHFAYSIFQYDVQSVHIYSCKIGNWIQFSSLQTSAWFLVFFFLLNKKRIISSDMIV